MPEPRSGNVIAVVSGKGGAGKTSVALSLAKYLVLLGKKVLVVDADCATHGATYVVRRGDRPTAGLAEVVAGAEPLGDIRTLVESTPDGFGFVASRGDFSATFATSATFADRVGWLVEGVCRQLGPAFDYVIVDCQAGYNEVAAGVLALSAKAIIVVEADAVSVAAAKNVERQFGARLPEASFILVNKLYLRETASYHTVRDYASLFRHLPPIPFDFDVRESFGARRMPLSADRPTSYYFAIARLVPVLIPEIAAEAAKLHASARESRIKQLSGILEQLLQRRREAWTGSRDPRFPLRSGLVAVGTAAIGAMVVLIFDWLQASAQTPSGVSPWAVLVVVGGAASVTVAWVSYVLARMGRTEAGSLSAEVAQLTEEISEVRTLIATEAFETPQKLERERKWMDRAAATGQRPSGDDVRTVP